jgi:hypothetical protein
MTPQLVAEAIERNSLTVTGPGDTFAGYGVIGLPFRSGHVLALRRFSASSLGSAYTSVWHRDPNGRWTFYSTVAPDCSCARYFGGQVDRNVVTPIEITWVTSWALRVGIGTELTWQLTLRASPMTRLVNVMALLIPERAFQMPVVLRSMGLAADVALGAGRMNLAGRTPNGHRFIMSPRRLWLVDRSTAQVGGRSIGPPGPLEVQAALEDLQVPQRGLFATASARLERPARGRTTAASPGTPCGPAATVNGAARQVQNAAIRGPRALGEASWPGAGPRCRFIATQSPNQSVELPRVRD